MVIHHSGGKRRTRLVSEREEKRRWGPEPANRRENGLRRPVHLTKEGKGGEEAEQNPT